MTEHQCAGDAEQTSPPWDAARHRREIEPRPGGGVVATPGAPTETEITAAVYGRWTRPREGGLSLSAEFADAFGAALAAADGLWDTDDFRPSELDRLDGLLSAAGTAVRREAEAKLLDALVTALAAFAAEHPDAPRA